ncbi:MAG: hypothetical protein RIC55_36265 [Pirellulaceae bacterium]
MKTICATSFEQGDVLGVVEGPASAVANYLDNAGPGVVRGKRRSIKSADELITNQEDIVKVTTYTKEPRQLPPPLFAPSAAAPVVNLHPSSSGQHAPLGLPSWDFGKAPPPPTAAAGGLTTSQTNNHTPNAASPQNKPLGLPSTR